MGFRSQRRGWRLKRAHGTQRVGISLSPETTKGEEPSGSREAGVKRRRGLQRGGGIPLHLFPTTTLWTPSGDKRDGNGLEEKKRNESKLTERGPARKAVA